MVVPSGGTAMFRPRERMMRSLTALALLTLKRIFVEQRKRDRLTQDRSHPGADSANTVLANTLGA